MSDPSRQNVGTAPYQPNEVILESPLEAKRGGRAKARGGGTGPTSDRLSGAPALHIVVWSACSLEGESLSGCSGG